jgi:endonuclease/exonuclease/phosphatase (EEP) superfamily protein YafD
MRLLRVVFWSVFALQALLMAGLCAGAAVGAQFGRTNLDWDILTHFAPVWLVGAAISIALGLVLRGYLRALVVALGLVGAVAAGSLILPEYLRDAGPRAPADAADQLKVIQFNVWHSNPEPERLVDWLIREDPDIVVLEESNGRLADVVQAKTDWHVTCAKCEVMIVSKARPESAGRPALPGRSAGPLTRATFRDRRGEFSVIGIHNAWPTDIADQQAQEHRLAQVVAMSPRERTIVAGDFNSAPWSFSRRRWDQAFGLLRRDRAIPTWPAMQYKRLRWLGAFPFLAIDHIYAGPGWATVKVERGPRLSSDHYPVIVTLAPVAPR